MLRKEFEEYMKLVYPQGVSEVQHKECFQAYIAGASVLFEKFTSVDHPDEIQALYEDLEQESNNILEMIKRKGG